MCQTGDEGGPGPQVCELAAGGLNLVAQLGFFDVHVFEFAGVEYLAAFEALHVFGIFIAGNDLDTRMFAWIHGLALIEDWLGRD